MTGVALGIGTVCPKFHVASLTRQKETSREGAVSLTEIILRKDTVTSLYQRFRKTRGTLFVGGLATLRLLCVSVTSLE